MKDINRLYDLYLKFGHEMYNAETQQLEALKEAIKKVHSRILFQIIEEHIDHTEVHIDRLEIVFKVVAKFPAGEQSQAMKGLIREMIETMNRCTEPEIRDAGLVASLQQIEQFEIATYDVLCNFAKILERENELKMLLATLEEERGFTESLSKIARLTINKKALRVPAT